MKIDVLGGSYENKYVDFNSQRCINWYPTVTMKNEKNRDSIALFPTPGLSNHTASLGEVGKCIYTVHDLSGDDRCFAVIDNLLVEIFVDGSTTTRGILSGNVNSTQPAYMRADSENHLMIVSDNTGDTYDLRLNILSPMADIDWPGSDTLDYVDGYYLITPKTDAVGRVRFSELNNPQDWRGDSVFTPTTQGDGVKRIIAWREELYCFGASTIEVYLNDGQSPFSRRRGTSQPYGLAAKHAADLSHTGIMFLGGSEKGIPAVYRYESDYTLKPVSPPSITWKLGQLQSVADCTSFIQYTKDGHILWYLHVPELETTLVYDMTTEMWHERQSKKPYNDVDGSPLYGMFRGVMGTTFKGLNLFVDRYSGKILKEDYSTHTEANEHIKRQYTTPVLVQDERYISAHSLEIVHNHGVGPGTLMVSCSKDGGHTFVGERTMVLPNHGGYSTRSRILKLGRARRWVIDVTCTDAIDIMLEGMIVDGDLGGR